MRRGVRFVLEDPSALCSGYSAGVSGSELAAQLGVSKHTVYRLLKAQGVELRPSGRERRQLDRVDIVLRYAQGWTLNAIARRHRCYRPTIRRVLKDAGILAFQDPGVSKVRRALSREQARERPSGSPPQSANPAPQSQALSNG